MRHVTVQSVTLFFGDGVEDGGGMGDVNLSGIHGN